MAKKPPLPCPTRIRRFSYRIRAQPCLMSIDIGTTMTGHQAQREQPTNSKLYRKHRNWHGTTMPLTWKTLQTRREHNR